MKKLLFSLFFVSYVFLAPFFPGFAAPQSDTSGTGGTINLCPDSSKTGISVPGCGKALSVGVIVSYAVSILFFVAFIIALMYLIWGGIKWVMSGGEKDNANKARDTVTAALIGLAVVLASWLLINIVVNLMTGGSLQDIKLPTLSGS